MSRTPAQYTNLAEHLPERREITQAWTGYLDRLTAAAEVMRLVAA